MTKQNRANDPYSIIKSRYVTEKSVVLQGLKDADSNSCVAAFESPKEVFLVDPKANKAQIKTAIEEIYREQSVTVAKVNTLNVKPKTKRRGKGRPGKSSAFKKAVVTFAVGDSIDNV